jgi:hypothetical protein
VITLAMTDEELMLQMNILASKTDSNPNMPYKANATLNKGLNPTYFTGQSTKIVNAINDLASKANNSTLVAQNVADKVNEILLDITTTDNAPIWANVKELMGKDTIIEGLESILQGQRQEQILGISAKDKGKVLSIDTDDQGNAVLKAIDMIASTPSSMEALYVSYTNAKVPTVKNVKTALDNIFNQLANGNTGDGGLGGGTIVGNITWDMIMDKPNVASELGIESDNLVLRDSDGYVLSSISFMTDDEVNEILEDMQN